VTLQERIGQPAGQPTPKHDPRTEPTQAAPTINVLGHASTPWQLPWPDGCIARYWTIAGATVDITTTNDGPLQRWRAACTGCPYKDEFGIDSNAHRDAQTHADRCRALPRPAVTT
jgi:hypothetical protein